MKDLMARPPALPPRRQTEPDAAQRARGEALARISLRQNRARPVYPPAPAIGKIARRVARKVIKDKGAPLARLRDQWPDIVGDEIAALSRPQKVTGSKTGRTLTLIVLPAAAPLIQHQSETIRQRVSVAAGGDITKLKLVHGQPGATPSGKKPAVQKTLSADARARLEASVQNITDPALQAAIVALGQVVLAEED